MNGREITVSYWKIGGKRPGPVLTAIAGQHGMEHSGPCLLPELAEELDRSDFAGTVYICPCANPGALELDYEFYPEREDVSKIGDYYYSFFRHYYCPWGLGRQEAQTLYNMNRVWNKEGEGLVFDITRWLWREIVEPADVVVDMHCFQGRKPFIYSRDGENSGLLSLPGIECVILREKNVNDYASGNLTRRATASGKFGITVEFSIQHGLKEHEYEQGKNVVRNLMKGLDMLPGEVVHLNPVWMIREDCAVSRYVAGHAGHVRFMADEYGSVKKGDLLYEIRDIQTLEAVERGYADRDGIVHGLTIMPLARPEQLLCRVSDAVLLAPAGQVIKTQKELELCLTD